MSGDHNASTSEKQNVTIDIGHYRKMVKQMIEMRRYKSALFWSEKVCVLSEFEPRDIYYQAQCMYLLGEYHRAAHILRHYKLEKTSLPCYALLLECLYAGKEYNEASTIMQLVDVEFMTTSLINQPIDAGGGYVESNSVFGGEESNRNELLASICLLKGKIFEALDNRGTAMDFYVQALHKSIYCYEALQALVQHEMLMAWEEKELIEHLPLVQQSSETDAKMILKLYESKLKNYYRMIHVPKDGEEDTPISNPETLQYMREVIERIENNRKSETNVHKNTMPKLPAATITITTTTTTAATPGMSPAHKVLEDLKAPSFSLQVSLSRASSLIDSSQRSYFETSGTRRSRNIGDGSSLIPLDTCLKRLELSTDLMAAEAEKFFYDCDYKECIKILNALFAIDPCHSHALTIQIGCLSELNDYNKLFYVAHKLVDRYPDKALSWYAVGCYYDLIGKSDPARRYLSKATTLDKLFGPAWLAYGHSFAKENEHDQAMAAYFKATQLMRGCHLPLLYIGVECGLTKNMELAEKFFFQAMSIAPLDVYVLHELGVIKYEYQFYSSAAIIFRTTVDLVELRARQNNNAIREGWEPLYVNLGHCYRKLGRYEEALKYFEQALLLKPQNASTYTSIGFVYALMWNHDEAINFFHKSLAINRDCIVTSTMLKNCLEDLMDEPCTIEQICGKAMDEAGFAERFLKPELKLKFDEEEEIKSTAAAAANTTTSTTDSGNTTELAESDSIMVMDMSLDV